MQLLTATCEPVVTRLPGCGPVHARDARRRARVLLAAWGLGEEAGLGELAVSELLANAICHGEPPVWMVLSARTACCGSRCMTAALAARSGGIQAAATNAAVAWRCWTR
jgi:hypothetical protein